MTAPAAFSLLDPAYCAKHGVHPDEMRAAMTHVAWKNHDNGSRNPKAQFRSPVALETIEKAAKVAGRLGVFDCSGVSDGAACALIVPAERRARVHRYADVRQGTVPRGRIDAGLHGFRIRLHHLPRSGSSRARCIRPGRNRRSQLRNCRWPRCTTASPPPRSCSWRTSASPTPATGWKDVLAGDFDAGGRLPINPDGGLKSFGHPVGASGLRMLYEAWLAVPRRRR